MYFCKHNLFLWNLIGIKIKTYRISKNITIKVDEDIADRIEQFGENTDKTVNYIFRSYFTGLKNINFNKL